MAELYPFQAKGAEFLRGGPHRYLGDEMGLGKTPQAIAAFNGTDCRSVHVIAPAVAVPNWHREIGVWADKPGRWTVSSWDKAVRGGLPRADVYIPDEAQYAKNEASKRAQMLFAPDSQLRKATHVWPLSGSPAPNNVLELWTWLRFMGATTLTHQGFLVRYCTYRDGPYGPRIFGIKNVPELRALLEPVFFRRMKKDVLPDLPPIRWGEISLKADTSIRAAQEGLRVDEDLLPVEEEHMSRARRILGEAKATPLAKFLAEELGETAKKIVVMAHHTSVLDVLAAHLREFGIARIDGDTPKTRRGPEVDKFQNDPACRVFLGQITAAGTAITLTAAADLVFAEMSWSPGDNHQAAMRVHRIGQTQSVLIRVATLAGSLDEAVTRVLMRKTKLLDQLFADNDNNARDQDQCA